MEGIVIEGSDSDLEYESEVMNNSSQSFQTPPNQKHIHVPSKSKLKNNEFLKIQGSGEAKKQGFSHVNQNFSRFASSSGPLNPKYVTPRPVNRRTYFVSNQKRHDSATQSYLHKVKDKLVESCKTVKSVFCPTRVHDFENVKQRQQVY